MTDFALSAPRGDTIRLEIAATRPDDAGVQQPVDLTGATLYFTMKVSQKDADDAATTIQKTTDAGITLLDAEAGLALVTIDPEDTDALTAKTKFYADLELIEPDGTVTTLASGRLTITLDVTRA